LNTLITTIEMENTNYSLQEKIQTLVNGEANAEAVREMAGLLDLETSVKEELQFSESLARALKHADMVAAAMVIRQVVQEEGFPPPSSPPPHKGFPVKYWIFGILGLSLLLAGSLWIFNPSSNGRDVARQSLYPMENVLFIPENGSGLAELKAGMQNYDAGQYAAAVVHLENYISQNPDGSARIYLGIALLMDGRAEKAIPLLLAGAQSPEPPIQDAAAWYLSLAYLETGNQSSALQILHQIPAESIYAAQAARLLEQL
jgi:hypothetical protein